MFWNPHWLIVKAKSDHINILCLSRKVKLKYEALVIDTIFKDSWPGKWTVTAQRGTVLDFSPDPHRMNSFLALWICKFDTIKHSNGLMFLDQESIFQYLMLEYLPLSQRKGIIRLLSYLCYQEKQKTTTKQTNNNRKNNTEVFLQVYS